MEACFLTMFEDICRERSLILVLLLTDADIFGQSKFTDDKIVNKTNLALGKLYRQRIIKEYIAMDLLEKQFSIE